MILKTLTLEIIDRCFQKCVYCSSGSVPDTDLQLSLETINKLLFDFKNLGGITVEFSGGEPMAHPDLFEIVEYAKDKEGMYFLICAGPLSNIIVHKLHQINKGNTYINFGSSYDPIMFPELTRWYQHHKSLRAHCCWWE